MSRHARLPAQRMGFLLAALPPLTVATACSWNDNPNPAYGVNTGGCFKCVGASGELAHGEELETLCMQTCLADAECRQYEFASHSIAAYYFLFPGDGVALNCCLERLNPSEVAAARPTLLYSNLTGNCRKEMACWTGRTLTSSCPRSMARSVAPRGTCSLYGLFNTAPNSAVIASGCPNTGVIGESLDRVLDAIAGPEGDTCGTESAEYYLEPELEVIRANVRSTLLLGLMQTRRHG